jgi:ABC-type transport system involved in cytochrome bd biosynthesis fused ATPase/permease subunit
MSRVVSGDAVFNAIIIMLFEIIAVILISIYLSQVLPQEYGPTRPWNYPFIRKKKESGGPVNIQDLSFDESELTSEDSDVKAERERVKSGKYDHDCPLVINGMRKSYGNKLVVKDATFAVQRNSVFGLLGPNGAGKTSLISLLTGVYNPTSGQAILGGYDSVLQSTQAFQSIGVCPQVSQTNSSLILSGMI